MTPFMSNKLDKKLNNWNDWTSKAFGAAGEIWPYLKRKIAIPDEKHAPYSYAV